MKQYQLKQLIILIFVGLMMGLSPLASAASADLSEPQAIIKNASILLKEKLQDESFTRDFSKISTFVENVIDPHMDFNRISALVLGKLWRKASREDRVTFQKEFKVLLVRTYSRAFIGFKDWSVRFLPLKIKAESKKIIVKTQILQPGVQPLAVNYRMLLTKGQWKVYDIMIEGVSLVTNYRRSIKVEFKKLGSLQGVTEQLAKRKAKALSAQRES